MQSSWGSGPKVAAAIPKTINVLNIWSLFSPEIINQGTWLGVLALTWIAASLWGFAIDLCNHLHIQTLNLLPLPHRVSSFAPTFVRFLYIFVWSSIKRKKMPIFFLSNLMFTYDTSDSTLLCEIERVDLRSWYCKPAVYEWKLMGVSHNV